MNQSIKSVSVLAASTRSDRGMVALPGVAQDATLLALADASAMPIECDATSEVKFALALSAAYRG